MTSATHPFHVTFQYRDALSYEEGVSRRDPSPVLLIDGTFHVWYSRSTADYSGYAASVWHATSPDGIAWTEVGEAIPKGPNGAFDEHGVFTPTTLVAEGKYWLYYTAVPEPFTNDNAGPNATPTAIGVAWATDPNGPWTKFEGNPVLRPGAVGNFDSHRVDDACLIVRGGKYWMYYKGREKGLTPGQTKMGLAIADRPTGPFVKHAGNPVVGSGHEVCVFPDGGGVTAIMAPVGPEGATVQHAPDGIHFTKQANATPPSAPGPYREDHYRNDDPGKKIAWGLNQQGRKGWVYLERFDCTWGVHE